MKIWHVLIALAPAGAAAALILADRHHHEAELRGLRAEVASLSTSVESRQRAEDGEGAAGLLRRIAPLPPAPAPQDPSQPVAAPAPRPEPEAERPRAVEPKEARAKLEVTFAGEPADAQWAPRARSTAEGKLAAAMPGTSTLRAVECRSSMCRFETVHEDLDSYHRFLQTAFFSPETHVWNGGFFSTMLDERQDGKLVTVAYLAREGAELPPVGQSL